MKRLYAALALAGLVAVSAFFSTAPARAADMGACSPVEVSIDLKPGSATNPINLSSNGLIPVALLSTDSFDAAHFTPEMTHLSDAASGMTCAGAVAVRTAIQDVNGDGRADQVFFFKTADLNFTPSTTAAMFMAHGTNAQGETIHILGIDSVTIVLK